MWNSLHVMCVKVPFWRYYCKCGVLGKQFFFFSFVFFFLIVFKYNLLSHYFRSRIVSACNKCKKKLRYSLHCSSDPSLQSLMVSQRLDAWIHFSWFAQVNWSALQVSRWSKKNHTNRDQSLTRTICFFNTITLTVEVALYLALAL